MGFILEGIYVGYEQRDFEDDSGKVNTRTSINVATGSLAYRVYLKDGGDLDLLKAISIGDTIRVKLKVYVSKSGKLSCVDGEIE